MSNSELPRTDWLDLAVMSRSDDEYSDQWGTILDEENFDRLDRETMVSGPYADRPATAPHDGAKYHATDVNAVFAWDAATAAWNVLNTGTSERPVPGTTHVESVSTDALSIGGDTATSFDDFGGGGSQRVHTYVLDEEDGTYYAKSDDFPDYSDSSAARVLQNACDALDGSVTGSASGGQSDGVAGGTVLVTRGEYPLEETVTVERGVRVVGVQPDLLYGENNHEFANCVFRASEALPDEAPLFDTAAGDGHVGFHNFTIRGSGAPNVGIELAPGSEATVVENVFVSDLDRPGIWTRGSGETWVSNTSVVRCGDDEHPAVLVESEDDTLGNPTEDTSLRWYAGRIGNDDGYTALEFSSLLGRWYDTTFDQSDTPSSDGVATVVHDGRTLELSGCTVTASGDDGTIGLAQTANNYLRLRDSLVSNADVGVDLDGNQDTNLDSVRVRDVGRAGIYVNSNSGRWVRVSIRNVDGAGVVVDGSNVRNRWSDVSIRNWDRDGSGAPAIDVRGVKGGKPGDVPVIDGLDLGYADREASIGNPQLCIVDGEWVRPYAYSLGGRDGSIAVSDKPANPTHVRVDAGSAPAALQGVDGLTGASQELVVEHTGSHPVTLEHDATGADTPLVNRDADDQQLTENGQMAAYRYDARSDVWRQTWTNAV